ncbi:ankyrin repeat-containing domain protein [Astrocystis sublimbata]|nr:ankyrin repeat-containing domain protein [Astrocystis sublimbata]
MARIKMSLPYCQSPLERRREQNRLAQRRFRERHGLSNPIEKHRRISSSHSPLDVTSALDTTIDRPTDPTIGDGGDSLLLAELALSGPADPASRDFNDWQRFAHHQDGSSNFVGFTQELDLLGTESLEVSDNFFHAEAETSPKSQVPENPCRRGADLTISTVSSGGSGDSSAADSPLASPSARPIHIAAQRGRLNIVRLLLDHDVGCDVQDENGLTPLMHATIEGYDEVAELLLAHGATIGLTDQKGRSVMHWAVIRRRDQTMRTLISYIKGDRLAIINGITREGLTPLHIAVNTDFEAAVKLLLEFGADAEREVFQELSH